MEARTLVALGLMAALALTTSPLGIAQVNPYVIPSISLSPTHGNSGTVVTVTGKGFSPNVGITLHSSTGTITPSGPFTTDSSGSFTATVTITAASAPRINIRASGADIASRPKDTATALFTVDNVLAGQSSNIKLSGGSGVEDDTATDGVLMSITGASGISSVNVTTSRLTGPSSGVPLVSSTGSVLYFDVEVTLPSGTTAPSGATVKVCFTYPSITSGNTIEYYSGGSWVSATNILVTGTQICGGLPLSALGGTNFAVLTPPAAPDYTIYYIGGFVVVIIVIAIVIVVMRRPKSSA